MSALPASHEDSHLENVVQSNTGSVSSPSPIAQLSHIMPEARLAEVTEESMSPEEEREEREEVKSLNEAALAIPDSEALTAGAPGNLATNVGQPGTVASAGPSINWNGVLGHSASSLGAANAASSAYFNFAKTATSYSLNFAKWITQGLVAVPAALADGALSGAAPGSNDATIAQIAHSGIGGFFDAISLVATGGIDLTSAVASVSLGAAGSGVEGVRRTLGSEVLRSLAEFSRLVKREWNADDDSLPPGGIPGYSIIGVTKALSTWISIQIVTRRYYENKMLQSLEEIDTGILKQEVEALRQSHHIEPSPLQIAIDEKQPASPRRERGDSNSDVRITSSHPIPGYKGNVVGAEIGHKEGSSNPLPGSAVSDEPARPLTDAEAVHNLQRYSKLVLGVYGGVALYWLKGIPAAAEASLESGGTLSESNDIVFSAEDEFMDQDQAEFLDAASQMELEDEDESRAPGESPLLQKVHPSDYRLWDVITGSHDNDLFHHTASLEHGAAAEGKYTDEHTATSPVNPSNEKAKPSRPRFYVVTDHPRKTIILVFRGTLSVGDVAADLTCESAPFIFAPEVRENLAKSERSMPKVSETQNSSTSSRFVDEDKAQDLVHEGMYITAKEIASVGKSVHRAVCTALKNNPGYSLDIAGHSLGAGVSSVIAMMWADPTTGLTTKASGLPAGRRVHAYCFAVPCVTNETLGRKVCSVITSHTYSFDLVCRLSLGSIQDIRNASAWLCYQDKEAGHGPQTMNALMKRAFEYQSGRMPQAQMDATEQEFLVLRKTLEANMHNTHMFPPGKVLYSLLSENDLLPRNADEKARFPPGTQRLFRIKPASGALKNVFGQMIFSRKMLSSHMPNVYDDLLHSLA